MLRALIPKWSTVPIDWIRVSLSRNAYPEKVAALPTTKHSVVMNSGAGVHLRYAPTVNVSAIDALRCVVPVAWSVLLAVMGIRSRDVSSLPADVPSGSLS